MRRRYVTDVSAGLRDSACVASPTIGVRDGRHGHWSGDDAHQYARHECGDQRTPARRVGTSEEVAAAILFLASAKASFVTGHSLAIEGGKLAG